MHFYRLRPNSGFGLARLALLFSLGLLTVGAWAITLYQPFKMNMPMSMAVRGGVVGDGMPGMAMAGMSTGEWSITAILVFLVAWTIMMAAMMLPAAAPMILVFASAQARRGKNTAVPTWIFVTGYLLVWSGVGLLVYALVQIGSGSTSRLHLGERARWAPVALGAILIGAGVYQFTPLKHICLSYCRSPFAFIALHWRDGPGGALGMGIRHGIYCLGCCWALFAVLVAAGIMSLAWMLLITVVIFAEKVLPLGQHVAAGAGILLIILGSLVAVGTF
jgi:predicted metal-binding membrane protein